MEKHFQVKMTVNLKVAYILREWKIVKKSLNYLKYLVIYVIIIQMYCLNEDCKFFINFNSNIFSFFLT